MVDAVGHPGTSAGGPVTDHLDSSPSETVRRHAATFRSVRLRLAARESRAELEARGEDSGVGAAGAPVARAGFVDGTASDVGGDGLRVLGASTAARVAEVAATNGWRVVGRFASHRRESDGRPVDVVVVMAVRVGPDGRVDRWAMGQWRTDPVAPPMKRKWKFLGATAREPDTGMRPVGARDLAAIVGRMIFPMNESDALE